MLILNGCGSVVLVAARRDLALEAVAIVKVPVERIPGIVRNEKFVGAHIELDVEFLGRCSDLDRRKVADNGLAEFARALSGHSLEMDSNQSSSRLTRPDVFSSR